MKINKMICMDEEFVKLTENINRSDLINKLLKQHFETYSEEKLDEAIEEKKKAMTKEEQEEKWKREIIASYLVFNGKTPRPEWVEEQIEKRKQILTDDAFHEIR